MRFAYSAADILRLARDLVHHLRSSIRDTYKRGEWTQRNLAVLRDFAEKQDAQGFPSDGRKQLLWDFVAYKPESGILLAVESEFENDEAHLIYDFKKLLLVRSPLKLMMCRIRTAEQATQIAEWLRSYMQMHCSEYSAGEVFVLYCVWWADEADQNRDRAFVLQIAGEPNHVPLTTEQFIPI